MNASKPLRFFRAPKRKGFEINGISCSGIFAKYRNYLSLVLGADLFVIYKDGEASEMKRKLN